MNITPIDIYLVSIIDDIGLFASFVSGLSIVATLIFAFLTIGNNSFGEKGLASLFSCYLKRSIVATAISVTLAILTPSSKTLAAMYVIPRLANSEIVSKDIPEAGKALIEMATEWMRTQTKSIKEAAK